MANTVCFRVCNTKIEKFDRETGHSSFVLLPLESDRLCKAIELTPVV